MSVSVEVKPHICMQEGFADFVEMVLEAVHESAFGLTYIVGLHLRQLIK